MSGEERIKRKRKTGRVKSDRGKKKTREREKKINLQKREIENKNSEEKYVED